MNKQIISEITRISTLMGVKPLITEQPIPKAVKSLLNLSDDIVKKFYKTGDSVTDDLLRKVRNGESLSDEAIELLLRNIDFKKLSKILIDNNNLGSNFNSFIDSIALKISNNPKSAQSILGKLNTFFDNIPFLDDAPEELITALKSETRERILREAELNTKKLKIYNPKNWGDLITLTDDEIEELVNLSIWDKVVLETESLFKPTKERLRSIQQIAKNIQDTNDNDTELMSKLQSKLKQELEWLYKKNTNNFVYLRNYFDSVGKTDTKWGRIWNNIKTQSDGGWDFYKSFGSIAQYVKPFNRIWGGIKSDLKVLTEAESKLISKAVNKIRGKEITKVEIKGSFWKNVKTGSRRGWPTMSNEKYKEIIQRYGPLGAKAAYFRDLVINLLKWNMYTVFFITVRNKLADSVYKNDIKKCADSGNVNSEECSVFQGDFGRKMAEWATKYRKNPGGVTNFWKNFFNDVVSLETNFPNLNQNEFYKNILEITTIDPGMVGEIIQGVDNLFTLGDSSTEDPLEFLDKYIKRGQENLKKAEDKVEEAINKVPETVKSGINKLENTPLGFKTFIINDWIDEKTKKSQLTGTEKFGKEDVLDNVKGDYYTVYDGNKTYYYIYNKTTSTFEFRKMAIKEKK
jgi:hypothetical protein